MESPGQRPQDLRAWAFRGLVGVVTTLAVVLLALVALHRTGPGQEAIDGLLTRTNLGVLLLGLAVTTLATPVAALRWRCLLPTPLEGRLPLGRLTAIQLVGLLVNYVLPGPTGELTAAALLQRAHRVPLADALVAGLVSRLVGLGVGAAMAAAFYLVFPMPVPSGWRQALVLAVLGLAVGAALVALALSRPDLLRALASPLTRLPGAGRLHAGLNGVLEATTATVNRGWKPILLSAGWAAVGHTLSPSGVVLMAWAMGIGASWSGVVFTNNFTISASPLVYLLPGNQIGWDALYCTILSVTSRVSMLEATAMTVAARLQQSLLILLGVWAAATLLRDDAREKAFSWRDRLLESLGPVSTATVVGLALWVGLWRYQQYLEAGSDWPIGHDLGLWSEFLTHGAGSQPLSVPPLMPVLGAWLHGADTLIRGAMRANALALALAVAAAGLGAAAMAKTKWNAAFLAVSGAAGVAFLARVSPYVWAIAPDLLIFSALTMVATSGILLGRQDRWWAPVLHGITCGLAFSAREHGLLVMAAAVPITLLVVRGRPLGRLGRLGLMLGSAFVVILLVAGPKGIVRHGTLQKAIVPLRDVASASAGQTAPNLKNKSQQQDYSSSPVKTSLVRAWSQRGSNVPALGAGAAGLVLLLWSGRRREALGAANAVVPLAVIPVVFVDERHLFAVTGAAVVIAVGGVGALLERRDWRVAGPAVLGAVLGLTLLTWPAQRRADANGQATLRGDAQRNAEQLDVALWLGQNAEPDAIYVGPPILSAIVGRNFVYTSPRALQAPQGWPSTAWRYWVITDYRLASPWEVVHSAGPWFVSRVARPAGVETRCLFGVVPLRDDYPLLTSPPSVAPGCDPGR